MKAIISGVAVLPPLYHATLGWDGDLAPLLNIARNLILRLFGDASGELAKKVIRGGLWQFLSRMLMRGVNLVTFVIVARVLSPSEVGVATAAMIVATWAAGLTQLGLETQVLRLGDKAADYLPTTFFVRIVRSALLGALIVVTAPYTAQMLAAKDSEPLIMVLGINFALGGLTNAGTLLMARDLQVKQLALRAAFDTFFSAAVTITVVLLTRSYWALTAGTVATTLSSLVNSYLVTRVRVRPRFEPSKFRELFEYGRWLTVTNTISFVASSLEGPVVARLAGQSGLGLHSQAGRLAAIPGQELFAAASGVLFSGLAFIRHDMVKMRRAMERVILTGTKLILPISLFMGFFAEPIVPLIFGERWIPAVPLLAFMMWGAPLNPLGFGGTFLAVVTVPKFSVVSSLLRAGLFLSLVWWLFGLHGLIGLIVATHISNFVSQLAMNVYTCGLLGLVWWHQYVYVARQSVLVAAICWAGWLVARWAPTHALQLLAGLPFLALAQLAAIKTSHWAVPWESEEGAADPDEAPDPPEESA